MTQAAQRMLVRRTARREGFSLLEILIVIVILGVIAALVVPNLIGTADSAKKDLAKSQVSGNSTISQALEHYKLITGVYPTTEQGLKALMTAPEDLTDEQKEKLKDGLIKQSDTALKDPWSREFKYASPGQFNQNGFDLWSTGPDGQDGSADDIGNWTKTN